MDRGSTESGHRVAQRSAAESACSRDATSPRERAEGGDVTSRRNDMTSQNAESERTYPDYCQTLTITDSHGQTKQLVFPKALDLDRPKRARTLFTGGQLETLERAFLANQYTVGRERAQLATRLRLSETQVKVWFQNRRTKQKKDHPQEGEGPPGDVEETCGAGGPREGELDITRLLSQPSARSSPASHNALPTLPDLQAFARSPGDQSTAAERVTSSQSHINYDPPSHSFESPLARPAIEERIRSSEGSRVQGRVLRVPPFHPLHLGGAGLPCDVNGMLFSNSRQFGQQGMQANFAPQWHTVVGSRYHMTHPFPF